MLKDTERMMHDRGKKVRERESENIIHNRYNMQIHLKNKHST